MEGRRFLRNGESMIAVRTLSNGEHMTVIDEANTYSDVMEISEILECPEHPYGPPQKGDFVTHEGRTYLVVEDNQMMMNGIKYPMPQDARVIRRFAVGHRVSFGNNYYTITEFRQKLIAFYRNYRDIAVKEIPDGDLHITEYTYPF